MKKLFIAAIVLVSMSLQAVAGPIVTIKIHLGKRSMDCANFGWCGGTVGVDFESSNSTIQLNDKTNELIWEISFDAMKGKESFIRNNQIKIEEDANVEADILKAMRTTKQLVIKAGTYPVEKTPYGYKIIIKQ